jgi:hypothetical protein
METRVTVFAGKDDVQPEGFKYKLVCAGAVLPRRKETVYPPSLKAGRGGRGQKGGQVGVG